MPTENARKRARKLILLPSGDQIYVPVITEIDFIDLVGDPSSLAVRWAVGQEFDYTIDNTAQSGRTVHVDELDPIDVNADGTPTDPNNPPAPGTDPSQQLAVERIDTWPVVSIPERGQEFDFTPDNKTGSDKQPPNFTTHTKTHIYRYFQDPMNPDDGGVWIDSELIDEWGFVDNVNRGQESNFVLNNQTNADFQGGDLSGQADSNDPDITIGGGTDGDGVSGEGTVTNPVRLDPFQNLVNFNGGGSFLLGGVNLNSGLAQDSWPNPDLTDWDNTSTTGFVSPGFNLGISGLAYGMGAWIALVEHISGNQVTGTDFYRSTDNGNTWTVAFTSASADDAPNQIAFVGGTFVAISTSTGSGSSSPSIWKSIDGGMTWSTSPLPFAGSNRLGATSLSVANKNIFIGISDNSTSNYSAYFFMSTDNGNTWSQSGQAFTGLQGQDEFLGIPAVPVQQVIPYNVAYSDDLQIYAAVGESDCNGYENITFCSSSDGLSWGSGKQFGDFNVQNPFVECPNSGVDLFWPTFFQANSIAWGNGMFVAPVARTITDLTCWTQSGTPGTGDFTQNRYGEPAYELNEIGVYTSVDGNSWTYSKIADAGMTVIPTSTATGNFGPPDFDFATTILNGFNDAFGSLGTCIIAFSKSKGKFLLIVYTKTDWTSIITPRNRPPPAAFLREDTFKTAQTYFTSKDGKTWTQVAQFESGINMQGNSGNVTGTPINPDVSGFIGLGPVPPAQQ